MDIAAGVLEHNERMIARAITIVENGGAQSETLVDTLYPYTGNALVWGITGPPGAGKSTLVDQIIERLRRAGKTVAVVAVDPSSPFSGGAILGDRLRMQRHATDNGVFIRSMASRGHLGGVSIATGDCIKVLDAAGFDVILLETIGVGQTEVEVMELTDMIVLVLVPGMGDEIQAMKAGVMEIGDVFVINKKDRDGADKLRAEVEYSLNIKYMENPEDQNPVCMTSANNGEGVDELLQTLMTYYTDMSDKNILSERRKHRICTELHKMFSQAVQTIMNKHIKFYEKSNIWVQEIYDKKRTPYSMIHEELQRFIKEGMIYDQTH